MPKTSTEKHQHTRISHNAMQIMAANNIPFTFSEDRSIAASYASLHRQATQK